MNFRFWNNAGAWIAFGIALITYTLTMEPTSSFWDCGEFISASYRLMVVHPPGAPLFLMLGRIFSLFAFGNVEQVAVMVNFMSALTSALTVLFTFWIISHFALRIKGVNTIHDNISAEAGWLAVVAGFAGAMALAFMDTFWFSAVEAEVYASSSFFTMLTFWVILKWEERAHNPHSDRWIILIAYLTGLAIGIHLLNLLVIPAIAMVIYYRMTDKPSNWGLVKALGIGMAVLVFYQKIFIPQIPAIAAKLDLALVNGSGMPINTGLLLVMIALVGGSFAGLWYTAKQNKRIWNTAILCFLFSLIGFGSYTMVIIRSKASPPVNMNDPQDPFSLLSYLNREQYGDRPLLYGPYFNAPVASYENGGKKYRRLYDRYVDAGNKTEVKYDPAWQTFFPRMGDQQKSSSPEGYRQWAGADPKKKPTFGQNMTYFFNYQLGFMYMRYFLWNFVGRQTDLQGYGELSQGNWLSGIKPLDEARLGPQTGLPDDLAQNKGRNKYYFIPLILGLIGLWYQWSKDKHNFLVTLCLFLFTGLLISVYLNAPPFEPRERDYTLVGSFQVFCIWIGLAVLGIHEWMSKKMKGSVAIAAAGALTLTGPVLMAKDGWDDHDRSGRKIVVDIARCYLESCAPNALLIANGDNDTYPLWYAQNVEGIRPDVRVINYQLMNTDWYLNALRIPALESDSFKLPFTPDQYVEGTRDYARFYENPELPINKDAYYPLKDVIAFVFNDTDPRTKLRFQDGSFLNYLPAKRYSIAVNRDEVIAKGVVPPEDTVYIVDEIRFDISKDLLMKADLAVLGIIVANGWDRPLYFTSSSMGESYLGMTQYLQLDGLAYRFVPVVRPYTGGFNRMNTKVVYDMVMNKWRYGDLKEDNYVCEQAERAIRGVRNLFNMASYIMLFEGKNDSALALVRKGLEEMPVERLPVRYPQVMMGPIRVLRETGNKDEAKALLEATGREQEQRVIWYRSFTGSKARAIKSELDDAERSLSQCMGMAQESGFDDLVERYGKLLGNPPQTP